MACPSYRLHRSLPHHTGAHRAHMVTHSLCLPAEASQMPSPEVSKGPTPTISLEKLNQELTSPVAGDRPQGDAATYAFNGDTAANNGYIAATNLQVPVRMLLLLLLLLC